VANDITHQSGAFGPREDAVFRAAVELALEERLPVVYLAANSGALAAALVFWGAHCRCCCCCAVVGRACPLLSPARQGRRRSC
jgi:hypothetical protein